MSKKLLALAGCILAVLFSYFVLNLEHRTSNNTDQHIVGTPSGLASYTNETYGWSFAYAPEEWTAKTSPDGLGIMLTTVSTATGMPIQTQVPAATITFSTIKKSDFKPVGTKVGNISFDLDRDALVDTSGGTARCLPALSQNTFAPNTPLAIFNYGGSLMSDPAYFWYAVTTNQDYLVLVSVSSYASSANDLANMVVSTLKLKDGVTSPVPECAE